MNAAPAVVQEAAKGKLLDIETELASVNSIIARIEDDIKKSRARRDKLIADRKQLSDWLDNNPATP